MSTTTTDGRGAAVEARRRDGSTVDVAPALQDLAGRLSGDVVTPAHPDYDVARRVWNGMVDRYPAAVVRCASTEDVVAAVGLARDQDLVLSVRGGGHNAAGVAVADAGIVIDLGGLKGVEVYLRCPSNCVSVTRN